MKPTITPLNVIGLWSRAGANTTHEILI